MSSIIYAEVVTCAACQQPFPPGPHQAKAAREGRPVYCPASFCIRRRVHGLPPRVPASLRPRAGTRIICCERVYTNRAQAAAHRRRYHPEAEAAAALGEAR